MKAYYANIMDLYYAYGHLNNEQHRILLKSGVLTVQEAMLINQFKLHPGVIEKATVALGLYTEEQYNAIMANQNSALAVQEHIEGISQMPDKLEALANAEGTTAAYIAQRKQETEKARLEDEQAARAIKILEEGLIQLGFTSENVKIKPPGFEEMISSMDVGLQGTIDNYKQQ